MDATGQPDPVGGGKGGGSEEEGCLVMDQDCSRHDGAECRRVVGEGERTALIKGDPPVWLHSHSHPKKR